MAYPGQYQSQGPWGQSQGPWGQSQSAGQFQSLVPYQQMAPMIPQQNYYPNGFQSGTSPAWNNHYTYPQENHQPTQYNVKGNAYVNNGTVNVYQKD